MLKVIYQGTDYLSMLCVPLLIYHPTQIVLGGLLVPTVKGWLQKYKMAAAKSTDKVRVAQVSNCQGEGKSNLGLSYPSYSTDLQSEMIYRLYVHLSDRRPGVRAHMLWFEVTLHPYMVISFHRLQVICTSLM